MKKLSLSISMYLLLVLLSCSPTAKQKPKPNIIVVLADDMGYGDIGVYSKTCKIKTPHIDTLASEGIMFTDAHSSSAVSTPTRYSLLTGRYSWRSSLKSGVLTGKSKALIPMERTTIASLLKRSGYHTAFVGKWHLGWNWALKDSADFGGSGWNYEDFDNVDFTKPVTHKPNDLGFDYAYGHSGSLDMAPYVYVENGNITQIPDTVTEDTTKYSWWRKGPTSKDFVHEDVTPNFFRRSFSYIQERSRGDKPFFLYLALPSPHTPILPTKEWQGKSDLNPYADFIMMIDNYMGKLDRVIKEAGVEENTIVIFIADNGCSPEADFKELEEKGHDPSGIFRGHKADIYEGGHRVPFIVKWPEKIKKGIVSDETICSIDLMATFAEIIGDTLHDNEGEDSYSLVPLFKQEILSKPLREATIHHSIYGNFAIRKGEWKLIMCPGSGGWGYPSPWKNKEATDTLPPIQLYNLEKDPGETVNVQAENSKIVAELKSLLIKHITEGRSTPGAVQQNDSIDQEWEQIEFIDH